MTREAAPTSSRRLLFLFLILPCFRISRPNEFDGRRDNLTIGLERSARKRLIDAEERALEALSSHLRAVDLLRAWRAHGYEPRDKLDACILAAAQRKHERLFAFWHKFGWRGRLLACCRRERRHVQREQLTGVPRFLVRLPHRRLGHVLTAVLVAFGEHPLLALVEGSPAQKADLEGRARRIDEYRPAAGSEMGGGELFSGVSGFRHVLYLVLAGCWTWEG